MTRLSRRNTLKLLLSGTTAIVAGAALTPRQLLADTLSPDTNSALIVIDVQNCFVPGGTLPVADGKAVVPVINHLAPAFDNIVITQDWHTPEHASFASSYDTKKPFETTELDYGTQVLWPDHCVQGTDDAALVDELDLPTAELIVRKGYHQHIDSYSAFFEADRKTPTGLQGYLKERGITSVYLAGLATDFCVAWTAIDAAESGFTVYVIEDACRGIDLNGSLAKAWDAMTKAGVIRIQSSSITA
ncbi:bifunctional nicotinamidase/pyrazinamidase [Neptunomonas phycophila]|jgi:nicotinamidase/pyrazinamidase|uniref:Nicotinamidase n=2 Tax=Bacteria TaxID=2 RepID=A0AAW7XGV1_9GAMM|nr:MULTISPECIES: bifunctional nicotinamidase/pyrazinamidase [Neptunomonas]MBT3145738.1 bifunctional nicotinamidase/pyrazinamidase [Neptunomonas phycophila]MDN2660235.1 bifunctional nicotinamidase/pyrazinamidase [Neptunomonas sp. CHC150]MDO6453260.1 bifunctional nicotinamidase/pyrazinamidase [Neptunomonas phycophila]MDO6469363.1 bifunctional nicotinamidase/pyrazinamidase [Neptunomonas phycophila]MDO6784303.1 bifunctional nicotinamidase/pyrazinamidase [Neptunomonas phycophila]